MRRNWAGAGRAVPPPRHRHSAAHRRNAAIPSHTVTPERSTHALPVEEQATRVALALGSNLGDRAEHLRTGIRRLEDLLTIERCSSVYETPAEDGSDQPDYLNMVVVGSTELSPEELLEAAMAIEVEAGRVRTVRNAPRTLDIDLVFFGDAIVRTEELTVPHPRWSRRAFVAAPLAEVWPEATDPSTGRTAHAIWSAMEARHPEIRRRTDLDVGKSLDIGTSDPDSFTHAATVGRSKGCP